MAQGSRPTEQNRRLLVHIARWLTPERTRSFCWSFATLVVLVVLLARFALHPYLPLESPLPTFFLAVVLASFIAGTKPAVLATIAGAVVSIYFFVPPAYSLVPDDGYTSLLLLFFAVSGTVIALFTLCGAALPASDGSAEGYLSQTTSKVYRIRPRLTLQGLMPLTNGVSPDRKRSRF